MVWVKGECKGDPKGKKRDGMHLALHSRLMEDGAGKEQMLLQGGGSRVGALEIEEERMGKKEKLYFCISVLAIQELFYSHW